MATQDFAWELGEIQLTIGQLHADLIRANGHLADLLQRVNRLTTDARTLDDLDPAPAFPATCRHQTPIADYCAFCQETPNE